MRASYREGHFYSPLHLGWHSCSANGLGMEAAGACPCPHLLADALTEPSCSLPTASPSRHRDCQTIPSPSGNEHLKVPIRVFNFGH